MTPERNSTGSASGDYLSPATEGRRIHKLWPASQYSNTPTLDHCIESKRRASLSLAPATVATMNNQRRCFHSVAIRTAIAPAFDGKRHCLVDLSFVA